MHSQAARVLVRLTVAMVCGSLGAALPTPAQAPDVRSRAIETLRVGSATDSHARFVAVLTVRAARNGEFAAVVRDSAGAAVVWFDSTGNQRWTLRYQFRDGLADIAVTGDTIAVLEGYGDAMHVRFFRVGRSTALAQMAVPAVAGTRSSLLGWADGSLLAMRVTHGDAVGTRLVARVHPRYEVIQIEPRERRTSVIWSRDDPATHALTHTPAPFGVHVVGTSLPWDLRLRFAVVPAGFCVSESLAAEVACVGLGSAKRTVVRLPLEPRILTPEVHQRWLAEWRARSGSLYSDSAFQVIAQVTPPPTLPIVGSLHGAPDGSLAVVRGDLAESPFSTTDSTHVDVFDRNGAWVASVSLPPGTHVQSFSGSSLLGTAVHASLTAARSRETGAPQPLVQIVRYHVVRY